MPVGVDGHLGTKAAQDKNQKHGLHPRPEEFDPGHALARKQMSEFGGVLSFDLKASKGQTWAFIDALDTREIHGYHPEIGFRVFTDAALVAAESKTSAEVVAIRAA